MLQNLRRFVFALALGAMLFMMVPVRAHAQYGQSSAEQRAYQAGYNNGVNDANQHKPLNLTTGNWKGVNLQAYQRGYQAGYRNENRTVSGGNGGEGNGRDRDHDRDHDADRDPGRDDHDRGHDGDRDRDREGRDRDHDADRDRGRDDRDRDHDADRDRDKGGNSYPQNSPQQRAYQAGYNNGVNDANQHKALNLTTGNWKGLNLQAYQRGYEAGYRSIGRGGYRH
jgi:hypothetical protein